MSHELRTIPLDAPTADDVLAPLGGGRWRADAAMTRLDDVSPGLERLLGIPASRWREESGLWLARVHPLDAEAAMRARSTPGSRTVEYRFVAPDGRTLWLREALRVHEGRVEATVLDVTRERSLAGWLAAQAAVADILAGSSTLADIAPRLLQAMGEPLGYELGVLWLYDEGLQTLAPRALWCARPAPRFEVHTRALSLRAGEGLPGRVLRSGRAAWVPDAPGDAEAVRPEAAAEGLQAAIALPLRRGARTYGVIEYFMREARAPEEGLVSTLEALGSQVALFLERRDAEERLHEGVRVSDERFQLVARATNDTIWDWDLATDGLWWNENFASMFGYGPEETGSTIESWTSRIHPDDLARVKTGILAAIEKGASTWQDEYRFRRKDGTWAIIFDRGFIIRDAAGKGVRMVGSMMDLTQLREGQERLQQSEERFRRAFADASAGMLITAPDGRLLEANAAFARLLGYDPESIVGVDFASLTHPDDLDASREAVASMLAGAPTVSFEKRYVRRDGRPVWAHVTSSLVRDAAGRPLHFVTQVVDVTARREAQTELQRVRHNLELILNSAGEGVYGVDAEGTTTFMNAAALKMLGLAPEEAIGRKLHDVIHHTRPDGRRYPAPECPIYQAAHGGPTSSVKGELFFRKDGTSFLVDYVTAPIQDAGEVRGAVTVFQDVTERQLADHALRESEARYRFLADNSRDMITRSDAEGRLRYVSPAVSRLLGYAPEELLGRRASELVHPEDAERMAKERSRIAGSKEAELVTVRFRRKDGEYVWLEAVAQAVHDPATGALVEVVATSRDVTERRRAEQALKEASERTTAILESISDAFLALDSEWRFTYLNPTAQKLVGRTQEELLGKCVWDEYPDARGTVFETNYRKVLEEQRPVQFEAWYEGLQSWYDIRAYPAADGISVYFQNITERKRAEKEIREGRDRLDVALQAGALGAWDLDLVSDKAVRSARHDQIFGYPDGTPEWGAARFFGHVVPEHHERVRAAFDEAFRSGRLRFECRILRADGAEAWVAAHGLVVYEGAKPVRMLGVVADVTERKLAEEALQRQTDLLAWQQQVLESIAKGTPLEQTLETLCREAEAQAPDHRFTVLLVDEDGASLRHGAAPGLPEHYNRAVDGIRIGEGVGSCGTAAFRREPVIVRDIASDPLWTDFKALALPIGLRACWSTPIFGMDGKLVGTWAVYSRTPGDPTPRDDEMVAVATKLAAIAIDRDRAERDLRYQRDLVRTITDNAGSALFMMDASGHPIFMNPAAAALTGYESVDEIRGKPLHDAIHFRKPDGSPYPMAECPIDNANAEVRPLKDQREVFCRKDGTLFPVQYNVAPVIKDGARMGAVIEVRDITEQERAEQALRQRAEELARLADALSRSNRELDQFAYITSHDLKAPLRGIANLSRWIEEDAREKLGEDSREHLELLRGRVHRMEALIDAILEYSRVGRVKGKVEEVDVRALVDDVTDLLAPPAGFRVNVEAPMPVVPAERMRLHQVFANLISNAIKHHHDKPNGVVTVSAKDEGTRWRFFVRDNGPGIAPRFHEKVFVIFQTLEARDKVEGTGIGLALVKKIVESNGGTVELDSDVGRGAEFSFTWPKERQTT